MGESPAKPAIRKDVKIGIGIVVAVVVFVLVGQCSSGDRSSDDARESSSSSETSPARPTTPAQAQITFNPAGVGVATARFTLKDGASTSNIRRQAQRDTVEILAYIDRKYPQAGRAIIEGTFTTTDKYGNSRPNTVVNLYYEKATLDKINFAGVDPDKIWDLRDAGTVLPDLANG
ncbi:MAG: hypothetical protein K2Y33_11215 [Mycolicibacterium frederiksbergense]|nr:hypothetical protein [Mycolicibacterium frederiksbergense]